jgi:hypothetical protein
MTTSDAYQAEQLKSFILDSDRRISCQEMAHDLETSVGSVYTKVHNRLKIRKVSTRF